MFVSKKLAILAVLVMIVPVLLGACGPTPTPQVIVQTVPVEVTKIVQVEGQPVTVVETQIVEVTAVPPEAPPVTEAKVVAPDPNTYTTVTFGDIDTMDPNLAYDTASAAPMMNVMEGLLFFNREKMTEYIPVLATEVPSVENGGISADGKTYVFKIRQGVKFHNGNDLTPSDFEYTFERGLLQSDPNGPQWLLIEPLMGYASGDITEEIAEGAYAGDPEALKANATPEELMAVCEKVKAAIEADDEAFTLTFNLAQPWGPWLATLAQSWGSALDKEWSIEQGAWDGTCETWVDHYAPGAENTPLGTVMMGTGPYKLESWTPDEGWVLVANENYWRQEGDEMWPGGPSGTPKIKRIVQNLVDEWGTRFAILQAGDAESVAVPAANRPQVDSYVGEICDYLTGACTPTDKPDAPLRKWGGLPSVSRTNIFMNFDLSQDTGVNPYIGSGQLDGNGIPPDFFTDIHVRKALNYCFDYDAFISDAQNGEGIRNNGPIIVGMLGYNEDGPMYDYDLDKCAEEMALAWDGKVAETGFRVQMAYNTGNVGRQTACAILQSSLARIDTKYQIECIGLPWPTMLRYFRAGQLPLTASGWIEDIHDPHNWVQPFTVGTYAGRQNLPDDLKLQFQDLVNRGVLAADPAERESIYFDLQQLFHDMAIQITLSQEAGVRYEQRWVKNWYYNPLLFAGYFYALELASE
ncbi:MAG: ABC transporter substrate-binding protein [Anaerolineae bacterium]|nr:ABC transporter substrate-binding protein [Anaerolineae bacterium]